MKLLEKIKNALIALILALWAWTKRKAIEWKLREKGIALWERVKAFGLAWGKNGAEQKPMKS